MIIGLTSDSTSLEELRTLADWTIRPRLLSTGGVAQVTVIGGDIKEYQILLDPARMKHFGVTTGEVLDVVENLTRNSSGGILNQHGQRIHHPGHALNGRRGRNGTSRDPHRERPPHYTRTGGRRADRSQDAPAGHGIRTR